VKFVSHPPVETNRLRSWKRPGDLPRVIEMLCLFASGARRNERKDTTISITSGRSPGLSQQRMQVPISSVNQQLSLSRTPRDPRHWSVTNLHKLPDQYHWALWNTHHIKLTFVTPTNKLSSFLLIFELFSLIFYWKYSIFLHETPHTWSYMKYDVTHILTSLKNDVKGTIKDI
jgi:hypothetical protein